MNSCLDGRIHTAGIFALNKTASRGVTDCLLIIFIYTRTYKLLFGL